MARADLVATAAALAVVAGVAVAGAGRPARRDPLPLLSRAAAPDNLPPAHRGEEAWPEPEAPAPAAPVEEPAPAEPVEEPLDCWNDPPPPDCGDGWEPRTGVVTGRVTDEEGNAVADCAMEGAAYRAISNRRRIPLTECRLSGDGTFRCDVLELDHPCLGRRLFTVTAPGFVPLDFEADDATWRALQEGAPVRDLALVLPRAAVVDGLVLDHDGQPVPGARIQVLSRPDDLVSGGWGRPETGADGRFTFDHLDPRSPRWLTTVVEGRWARPVPVPAWVRAGDRFTVELRLPPVGEVDVALSILGERSDCSLFLDGSGNVPAVSGSVTLTVGPHVVTVERRDPESRGWHELLRRPFEVPVGVEAWSLDLDLRGLDLPPAEPAAAAGGE